MLKIESGTQVSESDYCQQFKGQNIQSYNYVNTYNFQCGFEELW